MIRRGSSLLLALAAGITSVTPMPATAELPVARFNPEPGVVDRAGTQPPAPSFLGKVLRRDASGRLVPMERRSPSRALGAQSARPGSGERTLASDYYLQDGSESAIAIQAFDPLNIVSAYNEGWDFNPDIPVSSSTNGNVVWGSREFPTGDGVYGGYPFNPWVVSGNATSTFFASLVRSDLLPSDNSHTVVAQSLDAGATFTKLFESPRDVFQDRAMMDIDRPTYRGATSGPHDGKLYLCYDDWGPASAGYTASWLDVVSPAGALLQEVQLSGTGAVPFRGSQFQPVAGLTDGQVYFVSTEIADGGATVIASFHEIGSGGAGTPAYNKSSMSWAPAGQKLGTSTHWGVNGHRIDGRGFLDIDRSNGPRRSRLYFVSNRNPNPQDPTHDQGDIYLSVSTTGGASWNTARVSSAAGRTQYYPMLDVDDQGWVHVAYYENGLGIENSGVLNAGTANVLYTVSRDGGATWAPAQFVNAAANELILEDPPLELGAFDYYMLGDYMQMQATGTGSTTSAYILWTQYDKWRGDDDIGTKRQRVMASLVSAPLAPASSSTSLVVLALTLMGFGGVAAVAMARNRAREGLVPVERKES